MFFFIKVVSYTDVNSTIFNCLVKCCECFCFKKFPQTRAFGRLNVTVYKPTHLMKFDLYLEIGVTCIDHLVGAALISIMVFIDCNDLYKKSCIYLYLGVILRQFIIFILL